MAKELTITVRLSVADQDRLNEIRKAITSTFDPTISLSDAVRHAIYVAAAEAAKGQR